MAPDGEIVSAGISYLKDTPPVSDDSEDEQKDYLELTEDKENDLIYQIYESLLPFLFYSNRLGKQLNLNLDKYRHMGELSIINILKH
jgi:hypothetical protein